MLSSYMKKSCKIGKAFCSISFETINLWANFFFNLDRSYYNDDENDDFDEYSTERGTEDITNAYNVYKKKILKEFAAKKDGSDTE